MTSQDVLRTVLLLADIPTSATLAYEDVARWPWEGRRALLEVGWLRDAGHARHYACTECDRECTEEVRFIGPGEGRPMEAFIACHISGRLHLPPRELCQWVVDPRQIASTLSGMLGSNDRPEEVLSGRLWWLGRPLLNRQSIPTFLASGAGLRDAAATFGRMAALREAPLCLVLCLTDAPDVEAFGEGAAVVSLSRFLTIGSNGVGVSTAALSKAVSSSRVHGAGRLVPIRTKPGTVWQQVLIEILDGEAARVLAPGEAPQERTFAEMGLADRRRHLRPDSQWDLLCFLAERDGQLTPGESRRFIGAADFAKLKARIGRLRACLRALFPDIGGDPFKPYRLAGAYETVFVLRRVGGEGRP